MITTLIILALSAVFFVNGKIRSDLVALCALVLLMVFNILTPEEALSGFSNSVVIMMVGLFVVGGAIFKTGLAKMIGSKILHLAGTSEIKLFILIMLVTAFIGAFVSNTGTVALMLPIVVSMAVNANISPSRFLMPLAFASSMGGMATLIGTPPSGAGSSFQCRIQCSLFFLVHPDRYSLYNGRPHCSDPTQQMVSVKERRYQKE